MRSLRRIHTYLGCFFAPLLLFFILSGWYQTVTPNRQKGHGELGGWKARLTSVHVDSIYPSESASAYSPTLVPRARGRHGRGLGFARGNARGVQQIQFTFQRNSLIPFTRRCAEHAGQRLPWVAQCRVQSRWRLTNEKDASTYNNFYEFSLAKDAFRYVGKFVTAPWPVEITGIGREARDARAQELAEMFGLEERVYRFRCVEAWATIVPWTGFQLSKLIEKVGPKPEAKFIRFETFNRPAEAPGIAKTPQYPWPYHEGLRLDESDAPAHAAGHRDLRQAAAQEARRADAPRRAVEVRLQEHQEHREDRVHRGAAQDVLGNARAG